MAEAAKNPTDGRLTADPSGPGERLVPQLRAMMELRPGWYRAILTELAGRLNTASVPNALRVGDVIPDFVLPDTSGRLVSSFDLRQAGPLVVCFVRGGWCPFCAATLSAVDAIVPCIAAAGGEMVALTPDTLGYGGEMRNRLALRFKVLTDVDCSVALQFGCVYRVPPEYRDALLRFGIDLLRFHGDGPGLLPMPATYICDRSGVIRFAHVSGDITQRAQPALISDLVAALGATQA